MRSHRPAPGAFFGEEHACCPDCAPASHPTPSHCQGRLRAAYPEDREPQLQVGKIGIVSFQFQQRAFTSEWNLRHFLWEDKHRHTPEPRTVLLAPLGRQGVGWGLVSLCPLLWNSACQGKQGFLDKRCFLSVYIVRGSVRPGPN